LSSVILIGMPGAGKSTIGVILAKSMLLPFVDTDLLIQQREQMTLCEIIEQKGRNYFLSCEQECITGQRFEDCVVATGGSVVYSEASMRYLKQFGLVVYLKVTPRVLRRRIRNFTTRGIVTFGAADIKSIYGERARLYEKYADITIDCSHGNMESIVCNIIKNVRGNNSKG